MGDLRDGHVPSAGRRMKSRRGGAILATAWGVIVLALLAYTLPPFARHGFAEAMAWSVLVLASFIGAGSVLARVCLRGARLGLGLRAVWGMAALCSIGGVLMVVSLMTRTAALALVVVGALASVGAAWAEQANIGRRAAFAIRVARREPVLAAFLGVAFAFVALRWCGAVADWHVNPYDDDIAYLQFVKKLLDTGACPEPFSLRRLSAYGGQLVFLELLAPKTSMLQAHTFDRGICVVLVSLLIVEYRSGSRRPGLFFTLTCLSFFLALQDLSINTASYYSGVALFFGLHRTMCLLDASPRSGWKQLVPLALIGTTVCTLRQNYLPVPFAAFVITYLLSLRGSSTSRTWFHTRKAQAILLGLTFVALVPWLVSAWISNRTFLYPVLLGTGNSALRLQDASLTILRMIGMQFAAACEGGPIRQLPFFFFAAALLPKWRGRHVHWGFLAAAVVAFAMVVQGFTQSDAGNIARYTFAFLGTLAFVTTLEVGCRLATLRVFPSGRLLAAAGLVCVGMAVQYLEARYYLTTSTTRHLQNVGAALHEAPRDRAVRPEVGIYKKLQSTVPEGERLLILLDQPYYLDFARNPIWNLDIPGFASLPPGQPFFQGSEAFRAYVRSLSVRYVAFVRPDRSRYQFRPDYWKEQLSNENDMWRAVAPYQIDMMTTLMDLSHRERVLYDEEGMIVLELSGGAP